MPRVRGRTRGAYATDGGTTYNYSVDSDAYADASRGWTPGAPGGPKLPRGFKPRHVTGISLTTGYRGTAVVATTLASLWDGTSTTFEVEADDATVDTMTVIARIGEHPALP
jgi:hypothetical protein